MATVRLDTATEATLKRLAKQRGQTRSDVIRDAIHHLAEKTGDTTSALNRLQAFAGIADSGGQNLSTRTGQRFKKLLEEKRDAGDPR